MTRASSQSRLTPDPSSQIWVVMSKVTSRGLLWYVYCIFSGRGADRSLAIHWLPLTLRCSDVVLCSNSSGRCELERKGAHFLWTLCRRVGVLMPADSISSLGLVKGNLARLRSIRRSDRIFGLTWKSRLLHSNYSSPHGQFINVSNVLLAETHNFVG